MKIMFLHHNEEGFVGMVDVEPGTTIEQFLKDHEVDADGHKIRLNRENINDMSQVIELGDKISVTPQKISGA